MSEIADAISGTVADMFGGGETAPTEDTVQVTAPEAEVTPEAQTPAAQGWDFEAAGRDLFTDDPDEQPDFDAQAAAELSATETVDDDLAPNEYDDDTTRALKVKLLAERKKSEYHARQHLQSSRRLWETDVKEQPWARFITDDGLKQINATSHRDFNRQAKALARQVYTAAKPIIDELAAQKQTMRTEVTQEVRQEASRAWGKPTVGGTHVPDTAPAADTTRLDQAIRSRSMVNVVKEMIDAQII